MSEKLSRALETAAAAAAAAAAATTKEMDEKINRGCIGMVWLVHGLVWAILGLLLLLTPLPLHTYGFIFVCLFFFALAFICLFCGRWTRWFWPELFISQSSKTLRNTIPISVGTHNECTAKSKRNMFLYQRIRMNICPIVFVICSFITIVQFRCFAAAPILFVAFFVCSFLLKLGLRGCLRACLCVFLLYLCVCHHRM